MNRNRIAGGLMVLVALAGLAWGSVTLWRLQSPRPAAEATALKITVREEGLYLLTGRDLNKLGWDDIDTERLNLENANEAYPFFVEGEGPDLRILFYGRPPEAPLDRYTRDNVYILHRDSEPGEAQRMDQEMGAVVPSSSPAAAVMAELTLEENRVYSPKALEGRPWMWTRLVAPASESIDFELEDLADGQAEVVVELVGATESAGVRPDHHISLILNGEVVAEERWDGTGAHTLAATLASGVLIDGTNLLTLEMAGDTGVAAEIVLLDRIELTYPRTTFRLSSSVFFTAEADGLSIDPDQDWEGGYLVDLSVPAIQPLDPEEGSPLGTIPGHNYLLTPTDALLEPNAIAPLLAEPDLRAMPSTGYLAIGAPEFLDALSPLLARREEQGLVTAAVPLEAIYDQFGAGRKTPQAIHSFLRFAYQNWDGQPRYVLLVGDWSYDPLGHLEEPDPSWLPSFFMFTEFGGETVSDVVFAQLDEDDLPDIALGRFPARKADEVRTLVEKTLAFEALAGGGGPRRVLAVADGTEASFTGDAQRFLDGFSSDFTLQLLSSQAGSQDASQEIRREIDQGVLVFSYFGHGSVTQLGKDSLFTVDDAAGLGNGEQATIMVNITCLAGLFTHPTVESLAEAMLWNPNGGAVAGLSATSLTVPVFQEMLSKAFVEELVAARGGRLGEVLLGAQRQIPLDVGPGALEVRDTFLLFGDPALLLPSP